MEVGRERIGIKDGCLLEGVFESRVDEEKEYNTFLNSKAGWYEVKYPKNISDEKLEKELVSFSAIATVCDIVDLTGENRILVRMGLPEVQRTENIGLRALITETGLAGKTITEYHFGFVIGPCINAAGRLESAAAAAELFAFT